MFSVRSEMAKYIRNRRRLVTPLVNLIENIERSDLIILSMASFLRAALSFRIASQINHTGSI